MSPGVAAPFQAVDGAAEGETSSHSPAQPNKPPWGAPHPFSWETEALELHWGIIPEAAALGGQFPLFVSQIQFPSSFKIFVFFLLLGG